MKQYTPQAGRTPPLANIVDREDYKLHISLKEFRDNEFHLTIAKYIPEHGWTTQNFFLTHNELDLIRIEMNGTR